MNEVLNFLAENWLTGLELSVVIYEILVRVVKTERNLSILNFVWQILNVIIPNRSKKGGTFKMIALLCMLSLPAFSQLNGTFKTVRFVNVLDSTTVLPINGSIYYNEQSDKFRVYQNNVWYDLLGSGGGGSVSSGNGITVSGGLVNWGNTWSAPISLPHSNGLSYMFLDSLQYNVYIGEGGDSELLVNSNGVFLASYTNPVSINVDGANSRIDLDNSNGNVYLGSASNGLTEQNLLADGSGVRVDLVLKPKGNSSQLILENGSANQTIFARSEGTANSALFITTEGNGNITLDNEVNIVNSSAIENTMRFSTNLGGTLTGFFGIQGRGASIGRDFTINAGDGENAGENGIDFLIKAGNSYQVSGNSDGGTLTLQTSLGIGTGISGNIVIDTATNTGYFVVTGLPTVNPCGSAPSGTVWSNGGILTICP